MDWIQGNRPTAAGDPRSLGPTGEGNASERPQGLSVRCGSPRTAGKPDYNPWTAPDSVEPSTKCRPQAMTEPNFQSGVDMGCERAASTPVLMPGISVYADLRRENYAYVDKTRELKLLLDSGKFLFLARPRRFGKTLMLSTIECMYQGDWPEVRDPFVEMSHFTPKVSDELLFAGTSWEEWGAALPKRPVIRLDLSAVAGNDAEEMKQSLTWHVAQQALVWYCRGLDPGIDLKYLKDATTYPRLPQDMLKQMIGTLRKQRGNPVVLVDEYDTPLLKLWGRSPAEVDPFFELFREFFRVLKVCESELHKVLITGITRRAYGEMFSALNNLRDCTWKAQFGAICGFTESDLDQSPLADCIEAAADGLGQPTGQLRGSLRDNYNGYRFDPDGVGPAVYNPWSLCNTLADLLDSQERARIQRRGFPAHWSDSGVSKVLVDALRRQPAEVNSTPFGDLDELEGDFHGNKTDSLKSLMLQSGYLTHHPERDGQAARLGWPNREVARTVLRDWRGSTPGSSCRASNTCGPAWRPVPTRTYPTSCSTACTPSRTTSWKTSTPTMPRCTASSWA